MMAQSEIYLKLQDLFIKETGLKEGDTVKVIGKAEDHQFGWNTIWDKDMIVDSELKVDSIEGAWGIILSDGHFYPFFVLERIEGVQPQYVPYDKVKEEWRGEWIRLIEETERIHAITGIDASDNEVFVNDDWVNMGEFLEGFVWLNGQPCGRLVE